MNGSKPAPLLVLDESICDCGHGAEEHYMLEGLEGNPKPAHCDVDDCPCELFAHSFAHR